MIAAALTGETETRGAYLHLLFHMPSTELQHSKKLWDEEIKIMESMAPKRLEPEVIFRFHLVHLVNIYLL